MMRASEIRAEARRALRGNWGMAAGVGIVATMLSGGIGVSDSGSASKGGNGYLSFASREMWITLLTIAAVSILMSVIIGGVIRMGWCRFNLNLVNNKNPRFRDLFAQFYRLWAGFAMQFVVGLFVFLWSLLLVVPGIVAVYRYAMVPYLMSEFPDLGVMDAIRESKRLMQGNKWRLFCLDFSFLGWALLSVLTLGIGYIWLIPYMEAARAVFYMDVTGRRSVAE